MATLSDVARLAGVSLSTASRALNGSRDRVVAPELAAKALAAARQLNYIPDAAAQAMVRGHSHTIAVIANDIHDPYFSAVVAGVMRAAGDAGYVVTLSTILNDRAAMVPLINTAARQRPEALLVIGSVWNEPEYLTQVTDTLGTFHAATGAQVCTIGQTRLGFHSVTARNRAGAAALGAGLAERGFTTAAVLAGPTGNLAAVKRARGFRAGFAPRRELPAFNTEFSRDGGFEAMRAVLALRERPQLVFAVSDVMAVGALSAAREAGLDVPHDIAIAGFDDIPLLHDIHPGLTTARVPMDLLGTTAVNLVLQPHAEPTSITLSTTPVYRESTAVVPG